MGGPKLGIRVNFQVGVCRQSEPDSLDAYCDRTGGNEHKLEKGKFQLGEKKPSFPMRVVKHWKRLLRGTVASPSLELLRISGKSPEQPALVRLILEQGFELNDCQRSLLTLITLLI